MKVLVFAPYAGMWDHAFPEAVIAESLAQHGHEIFYVTCDKTLKGFCTVMTAFGLNDHATREERESVCRTCQRYQEIILNKFNFKNHYAMHNLLDVDVQNQIDEHLQALTQENLINFTIDGIDIGRVTLYQMLLEHKKNAVSFSDLEWQRVLVDMGNSLRSYYAGKKAFDIINPDAVIVYNSLYSVNHVVCKIAQKKNVTQYFLHAGGNLATRLETMILAKNNGFEYYDNLLKRWHDFKHLPSTKQLISSVKNHLLCVMNASTLFSYSVGVKESNVDIRKYFSIQKHQKVLLATMSSNDERFVSELAGVYKPPKNVLFQDQQAWLTAVIEYVKDRPDLLLVIRVHPREFANRRESVVSDSYRNLRKYLIDLPDNIKINWPDDNISLYQLAQEIDVCLNAWSSAGKELSALGIPVVIYSKEIQVYPYDINYLGETKEAYFETINKALQTGWSFEHIRKVFRWYAFEYFRTTLDISDSYQEERKDLPYRWINKGLKMIDPLIIKKKNIRNRAKQLKAGEIINAIISHHKESILDYLTENDLTTTEFVQETSALKSYLLELTQIFQSPNAPKAQSKLLDNVSQFLQMES